MWNLPFRDITINSNETKAGRAKKISGKRGMNRIKKGMRSAFYAVAGDELM
jgi:hypothetical protein